eukprot:354617-Chlamydomonas_euryale.AAC.8
MARACPTAGACCRCRGLLSLKRGPAVAAAGCYRFRGPPLLQLQQSAAAPSTPAYSATVCLAGAAACTLGVAARMSKCCRTLPRNITPSC